MRLLRVGPAGSERPAALDSAGVARDLSALVDDIDGALLGDADRLAAIASALTGDDLPAIADDERLGAPIVPPGALLGIGLNYRSSAAATGQAIPERPVVFFKPGRTVIGPRDEIEVPVGSVATDYEVELGVVLARTVHHCSDRGLALAAVGGYLAANDVTERDLLLDGPTWGKGKCADTFTPLGPWLVTADEVPDPQALRLELSVSGEQRQSESTADMAVSVGDLICYLSTLMTLRPGDVILTGSPSGVAVGRPEPKPYLRAGDLVELEVEGLGRQRTPVRDASPDQVVS